MLVAYHNTKIFHGFEYLTLQEIENYVYGNNHIANEVFNWEVRLLHKIMDRITQDHPKSILKVIFKSGVDDSPTQVWVEILSSENMGIQPASSIHLYELRTQVTKNGAPMGLFYFTELDKVQLHFDFKYVRKMESSDLDWESYEDSFLRNLHNNHLEPTPAGPHKRRKY